MRISLTDPRLTAGERRFLRDIAGKLIDTHATATLAA